MLDDRKAKSRAVDHFGMAFVHAEKAFEDAFAQIVRNADARVGNAHLAVRVKRNFHPSVIFIVFDGIVQNVVKQLMDLTASGFDAKIAVGKRKMHVLFFGGKRKCVDNLRKQRVYGKYGLFRLDALIQVG